MPEQINSVSAANIQVVSNSLDDFTVGSFGPEQANVKFLSLSYVPFDYNGKQAQDPVIAVQVMCSPTDGSNENKDFEVEWTTGAKMADFSIINNGGALTPNGAKSTLNANSNWALFLKSLRDAGFSDFNLLNGEAGINYLATSEFTIRRVAQPKREGMKDQPTEGGRTPQYYTCLKIISLPGETKKGAGAKKTTAAPAASKPATASAKSSATPPTASSNGSGSPDLVPIVKQILSDAGNTSTLKDLQLSAFRDLKDNHSKPVGEAQALARTIDEKFIEDNSMEHGFDITGTGKEAIITLTS